MPLNLAFSDPNYLDIATKQRVTEEVNIEPYIGWQATDSQFISDGKQQIHNLYWIGHQQIHNLFWMAGN